MFTFRFLTRGTKNVNFSHKQVGQRSDKRILISGAGTIRLIYEQSVLNKSHSLCFRFSLWNIFIYVAQRYINRVGLLEDSASRREKHKNAAKNLSILSWVVEFSNDATSRPRKKLFRFRTLLWLILRAIMSRKYWGIGCKAPCFCSLLSQKIRPPALLGDFMQHQAENLGRHPS